MAQEPLSERLATSFAAIAGATARNDQACIKTASVVISQQLDEVGAMSQTLERSNTEIELLRQEISLLKKGKRAKRKS